MRTLLTALTALMLFATPVVAGDYEDGQAAYEAGDYQKAFRLWEPLAKQGHAAAQYRLGLMYGAGNGIPENDVQAVHWFRMAAEQGQLHSQVTLGLAYQHGQGVPVSYIHAYAWFNIVAPREAETGEDRFSVSMGKYLRSSLEEEMTPDQIAKGQELAAEYWEKYVVPFQED